jgi:hypothetical protein
VLTLHAKRFRFNRGRVEKLDKHTAFSATLDMSAYVQGGHQAAPKVA